MTPIRTLQCGGLTVYTLVLDYTAKTTQYTAWCMCTVATSKTNIMSIALTMPLMHQRYILDHPNAVDVPKYAAQPS